MNVAQLFAQHTAAAEAAAALSAQQDALSGAAALVMEGKLADAYNRQYEIERQIAETPSATTSSVQLKLRLAIENARANAENDDDGAGELDADWNMVASALADLVAIQHSTGGEVVASTQVVSTRRGDKVH